MRTVIVHYDFPSFHFRIFSHSSLCELNDKPRLPKNLRSFPDIGGGGKRKPPPMHRKRRLREPVKIHQRRQDCVWHGSAFLDASLQAKFSGFLATLPMAAAAVSSKPPYRAGNLFAVAIWAYVLFALAWLFYQKIWAFGQENRTDGKSNRTDPQPQARPGSLNRTLLVSMMIYGGGWKI